MTEAQPEEVMNYRGLSMYLKMAEGTLRHWVMNDKIPHFKIGKSVRFAKKEIDKWLSGYKQAKDLIEELKND